MKIFFLCFIFANIVLLTSCSKDDNNPIIPATGTIEGIVLDAVSLNPLIGVTISTNPATSIVLTNGEGKYSISGVPAGSYTVIASKDGYNSSNLNVTVNSGQISQASFTLSNSSTNGTVLYSKNFDSRTIGVKPSYWIEVHSGNGSSQIVSSEHYSAPNSFKIGCLTSWDGRYDRVVTLTYNDSIIFIYKFKGDQNSWFRPMAGITIGNKLLFMAFNPSTGKIRWANGSSHIETATINKGVWYSVTMVYKKSTNKADYYLNGNLEGHDLSPTTPPSNSQGEGIILSSGNGGNNGLIYFDDLVITAY